MEREKYSIVFQPSNDLILFVAEMKNKLRDKIQWYQSVNSKAHITICEFLADENELVLAKFYIFKFCKGTRKSVVAFTHLDHFPHTLYIAPDKNASQFMKSTMRRFNKSFPIPKDKVSDNPHLTIGRGLSESKIEAAYGLFGNDAVGFNFNCSGIFLRKFNAEIKQFDIIDYFEFGNPDNELPESDQLSLFE